MLSPEALLQFHDWSMDDDERISSSGVILKEIAEPIFKIAEKYFEDEKADLFIEAYAGTVSFLLAVIIRIHLKKEIDTNQNKKEKFAKELLELIIKETKNSFNVGLDVFNK